MIRFLVGLIVVALGGGIAYYSAQLVGRFGRNPWAEKYVGGTREGYVLLGMGLMLMGIVHMFGGINMFASPQIKSI